MQAKFRKSVSKGTRFNQIYIPKSMEDVIGVGDEVEVTLIKKYVELHHSKGLKRLSSFKENLIKDIFSFLNNINNVNYVFIVGSFLTEKINYYDIDIILIINKKNNNFEETIYNNLIEKFNLRFHILAIEQNRFSHLLKICPLTKSMFSRFVCSRKITLRDEKIIDKNHIKFMLMMPYDSLEVKLNSRSYFDSLRRLMTIERFLKNRSLDAEEISNELKNSIKNLLYIKIKNNEEIEENSIDFLRKIIKTRLKIIKNIIKNGEE